MLLWFVGGGLVVVWAVLRDPALDYRLLVLGALGPDLVDGLTGATWIGHTLLSSVAVLILVMVTTTGRRVLRRRLLAVPIGMMVHLVLDGVWTDSELFWWPALGGELHSASLPSLDRWPSVALAQEAAGLAALAWFVTRFGLADRERRDVLVRTGRLARGSR